MTYSQIKQLCSKFSDALCTNLDVEWGTITLNTSIQLDNKIEYSFVICGYGKYKINNLFKTLEKFLVQLNIKYHAPRIMLKQNLCFVSIDVEQLDKLIMYFSIEGLL